MGEFPITAGWCPSSLAKVGANKSNQLWFIGNMILVGGLEPWNSMTFHSVGNVIIPTDELTPFTPSFFRWIGEPPTSFHGKL